MKRGFAQILKEKREAHGLSIGMLADKLGTYYTIVRNWETGFCYPSMIMLCSLADIFDCSIDELVGRQLYI